MAPSETLTCLMLSRLWYHDRGTERNEMEPPIRRATSKRDPIAWRLLATFGVAVLLFRSHPVAALDPELELMARGDFGLGATPIVTLEYDDGSDQEITAGNGLVFGGGPGVRFSLSGPHELESLLLLSIKYSTMQPTENADLGFTRGMVDLLAFYRNDDLYFRVGGGATLLAFGSLSGSGALSGLEIDFDPAVGAIVQADFVLNAFHAGLRATIVQYDAANLTEAIVASSLGVEVGYTFRFGAEEPASAKSSRPTSRTRSSPL